MDKRELFKKQLIEAKIFEENKHEPIGNIERFNAKCIKKYGKGNYREVALRIINYQVERYDHNLYSMDHLNGGRRL